MIDIFPYLIIYFFIFSLLFVERIKGVENTHKKYVLLFAMAVLVLFRGLRWELGSDWEQFHDIFYKMDWGNLLEVKRGAGDVLEPGYILLNLFVRDFIYEDYTAFLIVLNSIILVIYYNCAWRYFPKTPVSVFACIILFEMFFPLRFSLACSIVFFSYRYVLTNEFVKFGIIIAIATSIHVTSAIILPFYFLLNRKIPIQLLLLFFCISIYLAFSSALTGIIEFVAGILGSFIGVDSSLIIKMLSYTTFETFDSTEKSFKTLIMTFARSSFLICIFYLFKDKFRDNGFYNVFYNCFFVALFIGIIFKFQMTDILRMQSFFSYGTAVLFGAILGRLPCVKNKLFMSFLFLYAIYSQTPAGNVLLRTYPELFVPYRSIFGSF